MANPLDRLTLLTTFKRIVERGSISAAARDLGLSQASASRHLSALETMLGTQLVARTTHELSPTAAGQDCLVEARRILGDWESLAERFEEDTEILRGPIRIVAPIALGQDILVQAAIAFQAHHPGITIDWILDDEDIRMAEIGADIWIKVGPVPDDRLIVKPLAEVERLIVAAPAFLTAHPIETPRDLSSLPCAALSPFEGGRIPLAGRDGKRTTLDAHVRFSSNNIFAVCCAAREGLGYSVMPHWFAKADLEDGKLIDALPGWYAPSLRINASFPPAHRQTRRVRRFMDHLKNALRAL